MDKIKDLANKAKGATGGSSSGGGGSGGQEDYVDKGVDSAEKRAGLDSTKMRSTNEKVTDVAREQFEKMTGKNVPDKVSS